MYTTSHIFPVIPIKNLVYQDGEPTTPHKLETGVKPSVSNPCVLLFPFFLQKATAHVDIKALSMCHQSQNGFRVSFLELHNIIKGDFSTYIVHGK